VAKDEISRADELQALGWAVEDVRRYEELWEYRHRWGAINLEPEDRAFLRKAEAALPKLSTGSKGSIKKTLQEKSHYRWLAFYRDSMLASPAEQGLAEGEQGAWPALLGEELRLLDELKPVLGLPDTLKARNLMPLREQLIQEATEPVRLLDFDFIGPLEELKQRERTSWKPLRGEASSDQTYPVLAGDALEAFRQKVRETLGDQMRSSFPSLQA
jgi:hypothetical protein